MAVSAETRKAIRRWAPRLNKKVVRQYGISAEALLTKLVVGESADDMDAVSPAGARGKGQFMPGSRKIAMQKYGVDPWRSTDEAIHAAVLHLNGKINGRKGLEGYNPGDPNYPAYILSRKVGNVGGRKAPPTVGTTQTTQTTAIVGSRTLSSVDEEAALLDAFMNRRGSLAKTLADRLDSGEYNTTREVPVLGNVELTEARTKRSQRTGKVNIADGALFEGNELQGYTTSFLNRLSARAGDITVSSGTRKPGGLTASGRVSDHGDGSAADIAAKGKRLKQLMEAAFLELGVHPKKARQWAEAGGLYNLNRGGKRYQIIGRTNEGGNHWDHLHIGIRPTK